MRSSTRAEASEQQAAKLGYKGQVLTVDELCISCEKGVALPWHSLENGHSRGDGEKDEGEGNWDGSNLDLLKHIPASGCLSTQSSEDSQHREPAVGHFWNGAHKAHGCSSKHGQVLQSCCYT